CAREWFPGAYW
nr:immunoglobulin heavy chain junction region [Mus musculus]